MTGSTPEVAPPDAHARLERLQRAVLEHDRDLLEAWVSDRMIWTMPVPDNDRGKRAWIEASCSIDWESFEVRTCREVDLGDTRVVEAWVRQQRHVTAEEEAAGQRGTVTAEGVVVDVWTREDAAWRLVGRHPQRA